jgi:hypothetical protein
MAVCTKNLTLVSLFMYPFDRPTSGYHPGNFDIFLSGIVKLQNMGIRFTTLLTWMSKEMWFNKFPCDFTS